VQNWAEVLERGFLVLEETVRLANRDGSESGSCSCSECGGSGDEGGEYGEGMMDVDVDLANSMHRDGNRVGLSLQGDAVRDAGKEREALVVDADVDMATETDEGERSAWLDGARVEHRDGQGKGLRDGELVDGVVEGS
jgi:hypothetical protein